MVDERPKSNPTVPRGNGPLKSDVTGWTPIWGVNTSLVVARMSSPAEPGVARRGGSVVSWRVYSALPHTFEGPGDGGPVRRFLNHFAL